MASINSRVYLERGASTIIMRFMLRTSLHAPRKKEEERSLSENNIPHGRNVHEQAALDSYSINSNEKSTHFVCRWSPHWEIWIYCATFFPLVGVCVRHSSIHGLECDRHPKSPHRLDTFEMRWRHPSRHLTAVRRTKNPQFSRIFVFGNPNTNKTTQVFFYIYINQYYFSSNKNTHIRTDFRQKND